MRTSDLVFRTVGERTSELALDLAVRHIQPSKVHIIENVEPFSAAMEHALRIRHWADQVVYVDGDCLILDDLAPFLEKNTLPYVDCFVSDRFRGRIHCGVHVTRRDVVRAMSKVEVSSEDPRYVLRPESRLRSLALKKLKHRKSFRNFDILHDHFQFHRDIFAKYALRELRSRTEPHRTLLERSLEEDNGLDVLTARLGVAHARSAVPPSSTASPVARSIEGFRREAARKIAMAGIAEKSPMEEAELETWLAEHPERPKPPRNKPKVFGIGLSRTGTRSLTMAFHVLGFDTLHYPADPTTFEELGRADYRFSVLRDHDGITDITVAPFYAQLDRRFPGSKFILTIRDKDSWLSSARNHWQGRSAHEEGETEEQRAYMNTRRLLRAAVYGCYDFDEERFSWVYDQHVKNVKDYFRDRPESLLILDLCGGEGWESLCQFLGRPVPKQLFPHKGQALTHKLRQRAAQTEWLLPALSA